MHTPRERHYAIMLPPYAFVDADFRYAATLLMILRHAVHATLRCRAAAPYAMLDMFFRWRASAATLIYYVIRC